MSFFRNPTPRKNASHLRRRARFMRSGFNRGWVKASRAITRSRRFRSS